MWEQGQPSVGDSFQQLDREVIARAETTFQGAWPKPGAFAVAVAAVVAAAVVAAAVVAAVVVVAVSVVVPTVVVVVVVAAAATVVVAIATAIALARASASSPAAPRQTTRPRYERPCGFPPSAG